MRTAAETAILLAVILKRSGQTRARVSAKTVKFYATRRRLRSAFIVEVIDALAEFSWILFEISSGGFGAVHAKTLEAAKPVTGKRWLTDDERRALRRGTADWAALRREAAPEPEEPDEDE